MNLLKRIGGLFKADITPLPTGSFGRIMSAIQSIWAPGTAVNYQKEVGELHLNEVVLPVINFKYKAVMSSELQLQQWSEKDSRWIKSTGAQADSVLRIFKYIAPNMSFSSLIHRHIVGYDCGGNVFFYKLRSKSRAVVALQPLDSRLLTGSNSRNLDAPITHWEYSTGRGILTLELQDVLHTKFGADPLDEVLGLSQLAATLRAVYIVNSASNWSASTIRNQGKPSGIVSPKPTTEPGGMLDAVEKVKEYLGQFTADKRGEFAFLPVPVDIVVPGWKPADLELLALAKTNRESILSALGVPAEVLSWETGNKSYNNAEAAIDFVGKRTIIPMLDDWAEQWSSQLLPELGFDTSLYRIAFSFDKVWWLADETDKLQDRWTKAYDRGGMTVASYKDKIGEKPLPGEDKINIFQLQAMAKPETPTLAPKAIDGDLQSKAVATVVGQKDHDRTIKRGKARLEALVKRLASSDLTEDDFKEEYSKVLLRLHEDLYRIGVRHAGGTPDKDEAKRVAQQVVDFEQQWISGLVYDVVGDLYRDDDGAFDASHGGLQNRLRWYSTKASGTASQAWVGASDDDEEFDWKLGGAEDHCQDCPYIATNSPYTKDTLYTEPRAFGTPCGGNCDCRLVRRSDGLAGFGPVNW